MAFVDLGDVYATSGTPDELLAQFGLTPDAILDAAHRVLKDQGPAAEHPGQGRRKLAFMPLGRSDKRVISVIIPVFNEESTIAAVLDRVAELDVGHPKEVIIVDDGSTDETANVVRNHGSLIRLEHLPRNAGKGMAVRRGIELAQGSVVVIQDADLELSPNVIHDLVEPILAGHADAVYGSRFLLKSERVPVVRRMANRFLTGLTNFLYGIHLTDMETAHKAIRRDLIHTFELTATRFEFEAEVTAKLARSGAHIVEIASPYSPRTKHEGKKIRTADGWLAIKTLVSYRRWVPSDSKRATDNESALEFL